MSKVDRQLPPSLLASLLEVIAGLNAGLASTLVAHPLDLIKTRLQANAFSPSSIRLARDIVRREGVKALYRGCGVNIAGNSASWSIYFVLYGQVKENIEAYQGTLSYYDYFIASGTAGVFTALATNPIWVIKTRMLSTSLHDSRAYNSISDGARQIIRSEGLRGFYRGLVPSLLGVSHGALQFMAYEQLKIYRGKDKPKGSKDLTALDFLMLSGIAKVVAGSLTYPYQVVRTRLQVYDAENTYRSARDVVGKMWRTEGVAGFYKGLGPNLLRVLPSTWVTFLMYETTKTWVPGLLNQKDGASSRKLG